MPSVLDPYRPVLLIRELVSCYCKPISISVVTKRISHSYWLNIFSVMLNLHCQHKNMKHFGQFEHLNLDCLMKWFTDWITSSQSYWHSCIVELWYAICNGLSLISVYVYDMICTISVLDWYLCVSGLSNVQFVNATNFELFKHFSLNLNL